jgi:hypothetical protein
MTPDSCPQLLGSRLPWNDKVTPLLSGVTLGINLHPIAGLDLEDVDLLVL